jgi:hypothetical protein
MAQKVLGKIQTGLLFLAMPGKLGTLHPGEG